MRACVCTCVGVRARVCGVGVDLYRMSAPLKPWPYIRNTAAFLDILDVK